MINAEEISVEIARLEFEESSYSNYARLADLYIIRDHMQKQSNTSRVESGYSYSAPKEQIVSEGSAFLDAINGKTYDEALKIMDEIMDTLGLVNEKAYKSIMQRISDMST